jgi:thiol-disulfide isomerase/thioredoxin
MAGGFVAALLMTTACAGGSPSLGPSGGPSGHAIVAMRAEGIALLPEDRFALPTFDFNRFQSLMHQLSAQGVPVVVNIWASWCGPCRVESPHLVTAAKRFGKEVQFLGIDILDDRGPAQSFIKEEGYPYPSVFDPNGKIRDGLGYFGQPDTVFFDRAGTKVTAVSGPVSSAELLAGIRRITR